MKGVQVIVALIAAVSSNSASAEGCGERIAVQMEAVAAAFADSFPPLLRQPPSQARTEQVLLAAAQVDQDARLPLMQALSQCPEMSEASMRRIGKSLRAINDLGVEALKEILQRSGWPVLSRYGAKVDQAAFLIVQHADSRPEFQEQVLRQLEATARAGETAGENYALLFDRVATARGRPQRYGSQGRCEGRSFVPHAIEAGDVDARRKELGLAPLSEYKKLAEKMGCAG